MFNWSNSDYQRRILVEFIRLYKKLPALWNVKLKLYNDRQLKQESYKILLVKYREMHPHASMEDLKKRINSFRTNFRREFKKVKDSEMKATGNEKVYRSHLWYYEEFLFLCEDEPSIADEIIEPDPLDITVVDRKLICDATQFSPHSNKISADDQKGKKEDFDKIAKTWANDLQKMEEVSQSAQKRNHSVSEDNYLEPFRNQEDDYDCIAKTWANDLRKMDRIQQILARKGINDILFEGQLGTLHRNSLQINVNASNGHSDSSIVNLH